MSAVSHVKLMGGPTKVNMGRQAKTSQQADPTRGTGAGKYLQSTELEEGTFENTVSNRAVGLGSAGSQTPLKDSTKRCMFPDVLGQWKPKSEARGTGFPNAE